MGDSRFLLKTGDHYGWLNFGWGSCSGCDALEACNDAEDFEKLYERLETGIKWFASKAEALAFFREHDWEGDYTWHHEETNTFLAKCLAVLDAPVKGAAWTP